MNVNTVSDIAVEAGLRTLEIYKSDDFGVEQKGDDSPLTLADKASNEVIVDRLNSEYPDIPILSEESKLMPYDERKHWDKFWLVDPLDGTKEFIKRNDEFTVNIALIESGVPVFGVIYAPVLDILYYTENGSAYVRFKTQESRKIRVDRGEEGKLVAVCSRSHSSEEEARLFERLGVTKTISAGSSLKFCMVAEGKAHLYYRHGPTMEWDTAAGHAIALAAGACVEGLSYNKPDLLNGSFTVSALETLT